MSDEPISEILAAAHADQASVQALTTDLVHEASRGGIDCISRALALGPAFKSLNIHAGLDGSEGKRLAAARLVV